MRLILSDPRFFMLTGLKPYAVLDTGSLEQRPEQYRFPRHSVVSNLFVSADTFTRLPKLETWRAFMVVRHPHDLLVSWYLSNRYSHRPNDTLLAWRKQMEGMTDEEGMLFTVQIFDQVASQLLGWSRIAKQDSRIHLARFEDLTGAHRVSVWCGLLRTLGFEVREDKVRSLVGFYDIGRLRPPSSSRNVSKVEKYGARDLRDNSKYFTDKVARAFEERFPNLVDELGYSSTV